MRTITIKTEDFTAPQATIERICADAYKRGMRYNSFVYGGVGNGFHKSAETAERAAKRRARAACPDNPPYWFIAEMVGG